MPNPGGGPPDLVVACNSSDSLNIFYNKGDGTFYPAQNIPLNENSSDWVGRRRFCPQWPVPSGYRRLG